MIIDLIGLIIYIIIIIIGIIKKDNFICVYGTMIFASFLLNLSAFFSKAERNLESRWGYFFLLQFFFFIFYIFLVFLDKKKKR